MIFPFTYFIVFKFSWDVPCNIKEGKLSKEETREREGKKGEKRKRDFISALRITTDFLVYFFADLRMRFILCTHTHTHVEKKSRKHLCEDMEF